MKGKSIEYPIYPSALFNAKYKIEEIVKIFQESTIGKSINEDLSIGIILPLLYFLRMNKVNCHIKSGSIGKVKQVWIELEDFPNLIIDATGNWENKIIIRHLNEGIKISEGCQFNADFAWAFKNWSNSLNNYQITTSPSQKADACLSSNVKIASFLKKSQSKLDSDNLISSNKIYKRYFKVVEGVS